METLSNKKRFLFKIEVWLDEKGQWCSHYELPSINSDESLTNYNKFLAELTKVISYVPGSDALAEEKDCGKCETCNCE